MNDRKQQIISKFNELYDSIVNILKTGKMEKDIWYRVESSIETKEIYMSVPHIYIDVFTNRKCRKRHIREKYEVNIYGVKVIVKLNVKVCEDNNIASILKSVIKKYGGVKLEYRNKFAELLKS